MRAFVLASFFALAAGHRVDTRAAAEVDTGVDVDLEELHPAPDHYRLTKMRTLREFNSDRHPTLVPELTPKAGESLVFNIREHTKAFKNAEYSWEIAGANQQPFSKPVKLGRLKSNANAFSGKYTFKPEKGDDKVFSLKKKQSGAWANAFVGASIKKEYYFLNSKDGKHTYYTIEKSYGRGGRGSGHFGGGGGYGHRYGRQEHLNIYKGKCTKTKKCKKSLMYTGSGHKKGQFFSFYRVGQQDDVPVCRVDREYVKYGVLGRKDHFIMTVEAHTDSVLMLAAVSINDALNNIEENRD